ncbi:MAG: hypothetical protein ACTSW7_01440 [Candidatus Thorarchaeota archaeon]
MSLKEVDEEWVRLSSGLRHCTPMSRMVLDTMVIEAGADPAH